MAAIHIIKNDDRLPSITPVERGSQKFRSGFWAVSHDTATALIGSKIFFHEQQTKPAFFGGIITGFDVAEEGERAGRIIFTFDSDDGCKGVTTSKQGWAQEIKIVI